MRAVYMALLALPLAGCILAQESQSTPSGRFYGPLANGFPKGTHFLGTTPRRPIVYVGPSQRHEASLCAVPLVEVPIPPGINFTIRTIILPMSRNDQSVIKPLPACKKPSSPN
jgi:hypothetical protein